MRSRIFACALTLAAGAICGCASPFDQPDYASGFNERTVPSGVDGIPPSRFRESPDGQLVAPDTLSSDASPDDYIRFALENNAEVEAAYQQWHAASERLPQVSALPDPQLNVGFSRREVEAGVSQMLPWPGKLQDREDAASRAAMAAWRRYEVARLAVTERVVATLHELAYLDAAIRITRSSLELVESFEGIVRARYRVGAGSHPALIRAQVELGQVEDRLAQLSAMRPAFVADLNAALNRDAATAVAPRDTLPGRVAQIDASELAKMARRSNPMLLALDELVEEQRVLGEVARKDGLPDLTVGLEYTFNGEAMNPTTLDSGKDPIMLSFGINVPLWRDKYEAGVRETVARRLAISHERADEAIRIAASIQRAWFEHKDADRRVRLYETTLIPKAEESMRASMAGFRTGEAAFLDLLDIERTLLEFALSAERARADRGKALARLNALVGAPVPTVAEDEAQPAQTPRQTPTPTPNEVAP